MTIPHSIVTNCRVSTSTYNRQDTLNILYEAIMWNIHINNFKLGQFTPFPCIHTHICTHTHIFCVCVCVCVCVCAQYESTRHTNSCLFISNMRLHQQSVPSNLHFNPNLPQFFSLSYLNLSQMFTAYDLLTTATFRFTTWQRKRNLLISN